MQVQLKSMPTKGVRKCIDPGLGGGGRSYRYKFTHSINGSDTYGVIIHYSAYFRWNTIFGPRKGTPGQNFFVKPWL